MPRRLLLALSLTILFLYFYMWLGKKLGYDQPIEPEIQPVPIEEPEPEPEATELTEVAAQETPATEPQVEEEIELEEVTLQNADILVVLHNKGGVVVHALLDHYYETYKQETKLELVASERHYPGEVLLEKDISTSKKMFRVEEHSGNRVVFVYTGGDVTIRKTYELAEQGYRLNFKVEVLPRSGESQFSVVIAEGLQPINPGEKLKASFLDFGAINPKITNFAWAEDGDSEKKTPNKLDKTRFVPLREEAEFPIEWLGLKDNYFANVFMPSEPIAEAGIKASEKFFVSTKKTIQLPVIIARAEGKLDGFFYMGPIKSLDLNQADPGLEKVVDFGFAGKLSEWLFMALRMFHGLTGNWGWAIVILTILIRAALMPLMVPSIKSSFKMRKLAPKMEKLKQKYEGNDMETKQKLQQATMKLYKEEGVNPFSSCITMLAQMPVFIAYFALLRSSIYLRQADWMFWIQDLSIKDYTYVLPILMGATMWLSTNAMPMTTGDPAQQKMMKLMPIMFSFMFIGMPAGLIIYMITSNVFTLFQTKLLNRRLAKE